MNNDIFIKKERIQNRRIDVTTHEGDGSHVVICGELLDRRLVSTYSVSGEQRPPMTVHHMRIDLKLSLKDRRIAGIRAEMITTPHADCAEVRKNLTELEGECIAPGFTSRVKNLFGGRRGCIHLTTLLLAMAPAALQGYWVHNDRVPEKREVSGDEMELYLLDSCHVWRREGPLAQSVAGTLGVNIKKGEPELKG
ncbi:MAG: DUF2889 domain-containing protein [Desulfobacteraceae bacterium]|nr:DUF2889 domain-containing protein [Desulfobacteraceae bacterium]